MLYTSNKLLNSQLSLIKFSLVFGSAAQIIDLDGCNVYVLRVGWRYLKEGRRWGPVCLPCKFYLM